MPDEEIVFTARPKINSQSQNFRYGCSIICLPHRPKFSDFFDLCLHWVSIVRGLGIDNGVPAPDSSSDIILLILIVKASLKYVLSWSFIKGFWEHFIDVLNFVKVLISLSKMGRSLLAPKSPIVSLLWHVAVAAITGSSEPWGAWGLSFPPPPPDVFWNRSKTCPVKWPKY